MPTVSHGDVEIHYEDSGGSGRPVVLIHGWPLSGASWSDLTPVLAGEGYRVVTYDRRGFGQSGKPGDASSYDYDTLTSDLDALLTELDLRDASLVGFSMGGGEVARYVGPTARTACTAWSSPPPSRRACSRTTTTPTARLDLDTVAGMQGAAARRPAGLLRRLHRPTSSAPAVSSRSPRRSGRQALGLAAQADVHAAVECIRSWVTDFTGDLAKITVPTLVVHGDSDAIVPFEVSGQRTHEAVAGSELRRASRADRTGSTPATEEFNAAVVAFLAK